MVDPTVESCKRCINSQNIGLIDIITDLLSAAFRSNTADYVLPLFFFFFIHRLFSETTRPILTKFSEIVYSGVV